jgi:serine phosphatase RsbU (regulator of sigma subunit)
MTPFSLRYGKAIREQRLKVSMGERLRNRLWKVLHQFNESYSFYIEEEDEEHETSHLEQTAYSIVRALGFDESLTIREGYEDKKANLETFFKRLYPSNSLDVIEIFSTRLNDDQRATRSYFEKEINQALTEFACPWRLNQGKFIKIDDEFL